MTAGGQKESKPRGAITKEMVETLIAAAPKPLLLPLKVLFYAGLRKEELLHLKVGDLSGSKLKINVNKGRSIRNFKKVAEEYEKDLLFPEARVAIEEAGKGKANGTLLWPRGRLKDGGWNWDELSAFIRKQKEELKWPKNLKNCSALASTRKHTSCRGSFKQIRGSKKEFEKIHRDEPGC